MINLYSMLVFDEGYEYTAYPCPTGHVTAGIGHNFNADSALQIVHRHIRIGSTITPKEVEELFQYDLGKVQKNLKQHIYYFGDLKESYRTVLINQTFQMGIFGVLKFENMLQAMKDGNDSKVILEIRNSKYYHQTPERAERMIDIINNKIPKEYEI